MILRSSLNSFNNRISQLRTQLETNKCHDKLFLFGKRNNKRHYKYVREAVGTLRRNNSNEKIQRYISNIIGLYGALENFIESLIDEVVDNLNIYIRNSNGLPEAITNNYLLNSIDIIRKAENLGKLKNLKKLDVIESVYNTINKNNSSLIPELFYNIGGGNYRFDVICECFVNLGFKNIGTQIQSMEPCASLLRRLYGDTYKSLPQSTLYRLIDDLVDRRNDISHGEMSISIINDSEFEKYVDFLEKFSLSICSYLRAEMAGYIWNYSHSPKLSIKETFRNNTIIIIRTITERFKIGDWLACKYGGTSPSYCFRKIISIQVDNVNYDEYYCAITTNIGLQLDDKVNKNTSIMKL